MKSSNITKWVITNGSTCPMLNDKDTNCRSGVPCAGHQTCPLSLRGMMRNVARLGRGFFINGVWLYEDGVNTGLVAVQGGVGRWAGR